MKGIWKDSEVKSLFCEVEKSINNGESLKSAFSRHAYKYSRANGSVRNYYYHELDRLKNDNLRAQRLDIDLSKHEKLEFEYFSKEEEKEFLEKVENMTMNGMSVRGACLSLANGDVGKMLRYQNKYRSVKKKGKMPDNIIPFTKKSSSITDGEIQALFAGLVRLVKKSAQEEVEYKTKLKEEMANRELRKMMALLGDREKELDKLKEEFISLKKENARLTERFRMNACLKAKIFKREQNVNKNVGIDKEVCK